jgi:LuxR family transcriptional regulator, quorum-sensing system regulator SdiA
MHDTDLEIRSSTLRDRVLVAADFDDALDLLAEITCELGFTQALYGYIPSVPRLPNGDWLPLRLNVRHFPEGWEAGWEQFTSIDPYYRACFDSTFPIDWADVQKSDQLTRAQRTACSYLGDFGLSRGITVPVHLPFGRFAVMSAIADQTCANWHHIREEAREPLFKLMHVFTKTIHERHFEGQIPAGATVELTPREQECIRWASAGKTSSEIAIIIDRSVETVRLHIKNSIANLHATNRAQAVANAIHLGLI